MTSAYVTAQPPIFFSSIFNKIPIVLFLDIAYNKGTENVAAY